jgi:chaperone BCS1
MIAAMANYLDYDIYDIELTSVSTNRDLRKLFIKTRGKSIIVIEDIDCSVDLTRNRNKRKKKRPAAVVGATAAQDGTNAAATKTKAVKKTSRRAIQIVRDDDHERSDALQPA